MPHLRLLACERIEGRGVADRALLQTSMTIEVRIVVMIVAHMER